MKKIKLINSLISFATLGAIVTPIVSLSSCGCSDDNTYKLSDEYRFCFLNGPEFGFDNNSACWILPANDNMASSMTISIVEQQQIKVDPNETNVSLYLDNDSPEAAFDINQDYHVAFTKINVRFAVPSAPTVSLIKFKLNITLKSGDRFISQKQTDYLYLETGIGTNADSFSYADPETKTVINGFSDDVSKYENCCALVIPDSVKGIDSNAFYDIENDKSTIPDYFKLLVLDKNYGFYNCNLNWIGNNAFRNCASFFGPLYIPTTITNVSEAAFKGDTGFEYIIFGTNIDKTTKLSISDKAFQNCSGINGDIFIPKGTTSIGAEAFENLGIINRITIPNTVSHFGWHSMSNIKNVNEIDLSAFESIPKNIWNNDDYEFFVGKCYVDFIGSVYINKDSSSDDWQTYLNGFDNEDRVNFKRCRLENWIFKPVI